MKGLKKKAGKLSVLYGVDVILASSSPELNTVHFCPEKDSLEFRRIKEHYLCFRRFGPSEEEKKGRRISEDCSTNEEGNGNNIKEHIPCLPMPSMPPMPSIFHEEMAAMKIKLNDIRERLCFLEASSHENKVWIISSSHDNRNLIVISDDDDDNDNDENQEEERLQDLHPHEGQFTDFTVQDSPPPFYQSLSPPHLADFNASSDPPTSMLADFNTEDPPMSLLTDYFNTNTSLLPSDSPLWSRFDDWNWCGSLLDFESVS